jgi:hypothetical protein
MIRYGYCCINTQLSASGIRTGRAMIDRKFRLGGLQLASDIALANARDLLTILQWNEQHGIRLFRIGSELFPRWNHYELRDLPGIEEITQHLGWDASNNTLKIKEAIEKLVSTTLRFNILGKQKTNNGKWNVVATLFSHAIFLDNGQPHSSQ